MTAPELCKKAAEAGGDIVADAIKAELNGIPVDERHAKDGEPKSGIKAVEKAGLQNSFGIAPCRNDNGYVNVKVGFDGYNKLGKPNPMIARSVVKGTSFLKPNNFVGRGVRKSREKAEKKMQETVDLEIKKTMS